MLNVSNHNHDGCVTCNGSGDDLFKVSPIPFVIPSDAPKLKYTDPHGIVPTHYIGKSTRHMYWFKRGDIATVHPDDAPHLLATGKFEIVDSAELNATPDQVVDGSPTESMVTETPRRRKKNNG